MWSSLFRSVIQTYLPTCLTICEFFLSLSSAAATVSSIISISFRLLLVLFVPLFSFRHLRRRQKHLHKLKYRIRYGTLYANVNYADKAALSNLSFFCLRRLLLAIGTVLLQHYLVAQLFFLVYPTLFMIGFVITVRPMMTRFHNRVELVNEVFTLTTVYFILFFSDWCPEVELRGLIGTIFLYFIAVIVGINFLLICNDMGH